MNQNLARVNDQYISFDAVANESVKRVGGEVLDNLINRMIIQQACEKRGIQVSKGEVTAEISRIAQKFKMPIETWYQMLQTERGLNPEQYQSDIIWPMLALKKLAGDNVKVSQQDMEKAFVRDYGTMVKSRMIMLDNFRRALRKLMRRLARIPKSSTNWLRNIPLNRTVDHWGERFLTFGASQGTKHSKTPPSNCRRDRFLES